MAYKVNKINNIKMVSKFIKFVYKIISVQKIPT